MTSTAPYLEWAFIAAPVSPNTAFLRDDVIGAVVPEFGQSLQREMITAPLPGDAASGSAAVHRLLSLSIVFADISQDPAAVLYLLGARDVARDRLSIVFAEQSSLETAPAYLDGRLIVYNRHDADDARRRLRDLLGAYLRGDDVCNSLLHKRAAPIQVSYASSRRAERQTLSDWSLKAARKGGRRQFGVWAGDLALLSKDDRIDVIVNPENIFLDMARFHDTGISAIVRYLGAHWSKNNEESDDFIYRKLIERAPSQRPVDPGTAVLTPSGHLKARGVQAICHVAAVQPHQWGQAWTPGAGYEAVADVGKCVRNAFTKIDHAPLRIGLPKTVRLLLPIIGSGNGRAETAMVVPKLIMAATDYLMATPGSRIVGVFLGAYTEQDKRICSAALDQAPHLQRTAE